MLVLAAVWVLPLLPAALVPEGDTVVVTPVVAVTEAVEALATEEKLETELNAVLAVVPFVAGPV